MGTQKRKAESQSEISAKEEKKRRVTSLDDSENVISNSLNHQEPATALKKGKGNARPGFVLNGDAEIEDFQPGLPIVESDEVQIREAPQFSGCVKVVTWNVNGIRAITKSRDINGTQNSPLNRYIQLEKPDILCLQELKADENTAKTLLESNFPQYSVYTSTGGKKGYAGVAIMVTNDPTTGLNKYVQKVHKGLNKQETDEHGRNVAIVLPNVTIMCAYVENSSRDLVNLRHRIDVYNPHTEAWIQSLTNDYNRPVIWCGDLNVAHRMLDIWDSAHNQKSAGHTKEERVAFDTFLKSGWVDTFRRKYPTERRYTYWTARNPRLRIENRGWRLDYFVTPEKVYESVKDTQIRDAFKGSDHCPVVLHIEKSQLVS